MFSIIIILEASVMAFLSILIQFKKDQKDRKKIENAIQLPVFVLLFGNVYWIVFHHPDISPIVAGTTLGILLFPALTYVFSPASKEQETDADKNHRHSKQQRPVRRHSAQ